MRRRLRRPRVADTCRLRLRRAVDTCLRVLLCCGILLGPAAAIMGFIARNRIMQSGGAVGGGGMAMAGLILGIVGFVLWVIIVIVEFAAAGRFTSTT